MTEVNFYQDNKSKKAGIRYESPSGIWMPVYVHFIDDTTSNRIKVGTGLNLGIPEGYEIVVEGAPGCHPVSYEFRNKELYVTFHLEEDVVIEETDLIGHFVVAKLAKFKKVNRKKEL